MFDWHNVRCKNRKHLVTSFLQNHFLGSKRVCFRWKLLVACHYKQKRWSMAKIFWSLNLLMISFERRWIFLVEISFPSTLFQVVYWKSIVYKCPHLSLRYELLSPFPETFFCVTNYFLRFWRHFFALRTIFSVSGDIFFPHGSNCLKAQIGCWMASFNWIPVRKISCRSSDWNFIKVIF